MKKRIFLALAVILTITGFSQGENYEFKWNKRTGRQDLVTKTEGLTQLSVQQISVGGSPYLDTAIDIQTATNLVLNFDTVYYSNLAVFGNCDSLADGATLSFPLANYSLELFTSKGHYLNALVYNDTAISIYQRDSIMNCDSLGYMCYYVNSGYFNVRNRLTYKVAMCYKLMKIK